MIKKKIPIIAFATILAFSNIPCCSYIVKAEETTEEITNENTVDNTLDNTLDELSEEITKEDNNINSVTDETNFNDVETTTEDVSLNEDTFEENISLNKSNDDVIVPEDNKEEIQEDDFTEEDILKASPYTAIVNINTQEEWEEFKALAVGEDNREWSNGIGNQLVYIGSESEVVININSESITTGEVVFVDGVADVPTTFTFKVNGNINNSDINLSNATLDINEASISNSNITIYATENISLTGSNLTNTEIVLYNNGNNLVHNISNCSLTNSHISTYRNSSTINITDTNFSQNTKSIISTAQNNGIVTLNLKNVTATDCKYDFIHTEYDVLIINSIDNLNIATNESGLNGIYVKNGRVFLRDFKNSYISGFDYGVFIRESIINDGSVPAEWNNINISNCLVGIYCLNTTLKYTGFKNCNITGRDNAEYGIYFQSAGSGDWENLFEENYANMTYIDNCDISGFNMGVLAKQGSALVKDSYIHNVNSAIRGEASSCGAIRCNLEAKENPDEDSFGIAQFSSSGCSLIDCDIKGFYVGAGNLRPNRSGGGGSVEAYGCKFIDNIKNGICGYTSTANNCIFSGSTEVFFNSLSATNNIKDCTFTGDGNNIGAESYEIYLYINKNIGRTAYLSQFSNRDLSIGNTEFSNLKIALKGATSGGIEGGNGVYIHDCNTGISLTCNGSWNESGNYHIKDCNIGVIFRQAYIYPMSNEGVLIENCNIGMQDDYDEETNLGHSSWLTGGGGNGLTFKNCDIGLYLHKNFSTNSEIPFCFEGNRIGAIFDTPRSQCSFGNTFTLKDNSEIGIKFIAPTEPTRPYFSRSIMSMINENQAVCINGVINIQENQWIAEGEDEYYLMTPSSYLNINTPYTFSNYKLIFDMPDSDYQDGRLVAKTGEIQDYINSFYAKKEGWIVIGVPVVHTDVTPNITTYDNILTAGCLVSYDYSTNGGTSITGTVTGSEMIGNNNVTAFDKWKYKKGNSVDLSPVGVKDGYEFIGWNTDPNAKVGLTSVTADTKNITLYAIYKTTKTVTYHTFNSNDNYTQTVDFFNNETEVETTLNDYNISTSDIYTFAGYVLDENESDLDNNILNEGDTFTVSDAQLDVYCVYDTSSILTYKNTDKTTTISIQTVTLRDVAENILNKSFLFILANKEPAFGFSFDGWVDSTGTVHEAGSRYIITDHEATVFANESEIFVNSLAVTPKTSTIYVNDVIELTATITPNNALNKEIVWDSNDISIGTVDNGKVKGLKRGSITITATNERSGLSDTATIIVKDVKTENPKIDLSNDYKITITAGEIQDDELDKIYYRINGGEWQEYKGSIPVYKKFKVEAYQITKVKQVKSEIVEISGTEYATGITAEYIGEDKIINTDVEKSEVIVTVHYPNSPDETTTIFNLTDYTIKVEGPNTVTVTYNEYPEDVNSPTLTSTIEVTGIDPKNRKVTIKGILRYSDGTPIANKTIILDYTGEVVISDDNKVAGTNRVETTTDENGNYEFKDILIGKYDLSILDNNNTVIAKCNITVSEPKKDSVDITNKKDNVDVSYEFAGNIIIIDATITNPETKIVPPVKKDIPKETPVTPSPKTGDKFNILKITALMIASFISAITLLIKRKKTEK